MPWKLRKTLLRPAAIGALLAGSLMLGVSPSDARVTRIVIDNPPVNFQPPAPSVDGVQYQTVFGRAFGELDANDEHNTLITDIGIAPRNGNGNVPYIATFTITMPVDLSQASGVVWHDVPNRGGKVALTSDLKGVHDIELDSGWQGDNAGATAVPANADSLLPITSVSNDWVKTPVLTGTTGRILGRIVNRSGLNAAPLNVMGNPIPYFPANVNDNSADTLTIHTHETVNGVITEGGVVANGDWMYCGGGTFASPLPVTKLPVNVCMRNGFDGTKLYQLVFTVKDPYVLGAGTAAFRDVMSFFRYATADDHGTANPLAGVVKQAIIRGVSQSGNFTRHYIFLGMNEDESGRIVHDGAWPLIAGRRVANNSRWGQPDGVLELYQMGSEGPQWWHSFPDQVRDLHPGGILDRCERTNTCPKIIETFGGSEVFALKMTTSWVGTDPKNDIPLPEQRPPLLPAELDARWREPVGSRVQRGDSERGRIVPRQQFRDRNISRESSLCSGVDRRDARCNAQLASQRHQPSAECLAAAQGRKERTDAGRADHGRDGLSARYSGHSGFDLPAGKLRVPDL